MDIESKKFDLYQDVLGHLYAAHSHLSKRLYAREAHTSEDPGPVTESMLARTRAGLVLLGEYEVLDTMMDILIELEDVDTSLTIAARKEDLEARISALTLDLAMTFAID